MRHFCKGTATVKSFCTDICQSFCTVYLAKINAILKKSEENAQNVGEKILQDAEKNAIIVKENAEKVIENNQNLLKNDLIKRATLASVEVAKSHIINELNNNQDLHNKLIDESIEAIIVNTETEVEEVEG